MFEECYENGGKLLIAGNGGSAADSEHIAGELMKRFKITRPIGKELADKLNAKRANDAKVVLEKDAKLQNSLVADGCNVCGNVEFSILFAGATVAKGATVNSSIIMPGAVIEEGAVVGENPEKSENLDEWGVSVIGADVTIGKDAKIKAKTTIAQDVKGGQTV